MLIDNSKYLLTITDNRLEKAITHAKARLVVLEPIQEFLDVDVNMHRTNEICPFMKCISMLAKKYHCVVILIEHTNKNSNGELPYRVLGSIDFQAAAIKCFDC